MQPQKYRVLTHISEGSFGIVFLALNTTLNQECVLKIEKSECPDDVICIEKEILKYLNRKKMAGIPKYFGSGSYDSCKFMSIESLGPSLKDLLEFCGGNFTVKTTLMIGK